MRSIIGSVMLAALTIPAVQTLHVSSTAAGGSIHTFAIESKHLNDSRELLVRTPQGYETGESHYPVLVVLDADWHFNLAAADIEFLSECSYLGRHPIPEMIVVGIANGDRNRDFTPTRREEQIGMRFPTSGGAQPFRSFLIEEVLPRMDQEFRTHPYRVLAGWSLGGLFATDSWCEAKPGFDAFLAISPSLWWDDQLLLRRFREREGPLPPGQLVITLGSEEQDTHVSRSVDAWTVHLDSVAGPDLAPALVSIDGFGHNYSPKMAFFSGLLSLFDDWIVPRETVQSGLDAVDDYYANLSSRYHFAIPVPEDVYGQIGWGLFESGDVEGSGEVFRTWLERAPGSVLAHASLGAFCRETGQNDEATTLLREAIRLEELSETPRSGFVSDLRREVTALEADN